MSDRISIGPNICHGEACIKGTRIPVHLILRMMVNGDSESDLLAEEQITPLDVISTK